MLPQPRAIFRFKPSTAAATVSFLGAFWFGLVEFMIFPWVAFAAWAIFAVVAVLLSAANFARFRHPQFFAEIVVELVALGLWRFRVAQLFTVGN